MNQIETEPKAHPGLTTRKDAWWLEPVLVATGFTLFIIYATWRAFENNFYQFGGAANDIFLSPFYSPKIILSWWQFSPAILVLWVPAGFRATCYYYRKAYYRAYFLTPHACAVGRSAKDNYTGESAFPLVMQNVHRYFFYLATVVLAFLWYDVFRAFFQPDGLHVTLVNLVMLVNVVLLSAYSGGCHACRHLVGGRLDSFSCCQAARHNWASGIW